MSETPKSLTTDEESKVIAYFQELTDQPGGQSAFLHHLTGVLLMIDAGLRLSECTGLCWNNVSIGDNLADAITVPAAIAKGQRERIIPMTERLKKNLILLKEIHKKCFNVPVGYVKKSPLGYKLLPIVRHKSKLYATSNRQMERHLLAAGSVSIGRHLTPHMLRHTFATKLMRITNIRTVQELLGHKRLSSTQIYTHPSQEDLRKAVELL